MKKPSKSSGKPKASAKDKLIDSNGLLVILSAPSGCGKTTILDRLLKRHPDWVRSISVTTRAPREGEKTGEDYFFVSSEGFEDMLGKDEFLEHAKVFDNFYGTPKSFVIEHLKHNRVVILAIDVQGARTVRKIAAGKIPLFSIFVLPPSLKVLRERLEGRKSETPEQIDKRIAVAKEEIKEAGSYDCTVVNQNLDDVLTEIEEKIHQFKTERRQDNNVLRST